MINYMNRIKVLAVLLCFTSIQSCKKENKNPKLIFKYVFDPNGERLDNFGNVSSVPSGNATQTPDFKRLGIHSIELINYVVSLPTENSLIYKGSEVSNGSLSAIDFDSEKIVSNSEVLIEIPISEMEPGTYNYLRNSLAFQEYNIDFTYFEPNSGTTFDLDASVASFVGYRTSISSFNVGAELIQLDSVVEQGYFAVHFDNPFTYTVTGSTPTTTVVNPLDNVSPIPLGSCLVTGEFEQPLTITGEETEDITVEVRVSINNSFEWTEVNMDGKYEPAVGEQVVDMGIRGLKAIVK